MIDFTFVDPPTNDGQEGDGCCILDGSLVGVQDPDEE